MYNIYIIKHKETGYKYLGYDQRPLNKVWRDIIENYENWTVPLWNTIKRVGTTQFKISIVEEVQDRLLESRMEYWTAKYTPEYNQDVFDHVTRSKKPNKKTRRRWGYQRVHKPKGDRIKNVIKCRNLETGKLKTLHGWKACADFCNGDLANIKRAIRTNGSAYGYKWWIYKKNEIKRSVYGVGKEGQVTKTFDSISDAMRAFNEEDKGKGICTSIKWGSRWKGYLWYYSDSQYKYKQEGKE